MKNRSGMHGRAWLLAVFASGVWVCTGHGAIFTWDNSSGDMEWTNPLNWTNDAGVPGLADTAIFHSPAVGTCRVSSSVSVGVLLLNHTNGTVEFDITPGSTFSPATYRQGYIALVTNRVVLRGGGTFAPAGDVVLAFKDSTGGALVTRADLVVSNVTFDSTDLNSLFVSYNTHSIGAMTAKVDLVHARLIAQGATNRLATRSSLVVGGTFGGSSLGTLLLPGTLTGISVGATFQLGCWNGWQNLIDFGTNSAFRSLQVGSAFILRAGQFQYNRNGYTVTGFPDQVDVTIGSPGQPAVFYPGYYYGAFYPVILTNFASFRAWLSDLTVCRVDNNGAGVCYAELDLSENSVANLEGSITRSNLAVPTIVLGGSAGSATGVLRLPSTLTNFWCASLTMGLIQGDDSRKSAIVFGTNTSPMVFTVASNLSLGYADFMTVTNGLTNLAFPPGSRLRIGSLTNRGSVTLGRIQNGVAVKSTFGKGLSDVALYAMNVTIGYNSGNNAYYHFVTNDYRDATQFLWNVEGDIALGTNLGDMIFTHFPANGTVVCSNVVMGMTAAATGSRRVVTYLSNTVFAASNSVVIAETAAVTNYVVGRCSGFDIGTTNLDIQDPGVHADYGRLAIHFQRDPLDPQQPYWGLRLKGDAVSLVQALTNTSPQRLFWTTDGLSPRFQARFGLRYEPDLDVTYLGCPSPPEGTVVPVLGLTNRVMRGSTATSQWFNVANTNATGWPVSFGAATETSWIELRNAWGELADGGSARVTTLYHTAILAPGEHLGHVVVSSTNDYGFPERLSPRIVGIAMQVMELKRSVTNVDVTVLEGHDATAVGFEVWNGGAGLMTYSITSDVSWMSVVPAAGASVSPVSSNFHAIVFHTAGLAAGQEASGMLWIASPDGGGARAAINVRVVAVGLPELAVGPVLLTNALTAGYGGTNGFDVWRRSGQHAIAYTCEVVRGASWLSVSPVSGQVTGERDAVGVTFSAGLPQGEHRGLVRIRGFVPVSGEEVLGSPRFEEVVVTVHASPALTLSPSGLTNRVAEGWDAPEQVLRVINATGEGGLRFRVLDNAAWLVADPAQGEVAPGDDQVNVRIRYGTANLVPGRYTAFVEVQGEDLEHGGPVPGSPVRIHVEMEVMPRAVLALDRTELSRQVRQGGVATAQVFRVRNASQEPKGVLAFRAEAGAVEGAGERVEGGGMRVEGGGGGCLARSPLGARGRNASAASGVGSRESGVVPWLTLSPASGTSAGEWAEVTVAYDASALAPGLYQARVTVTGTDSASDKEALDSPAELLVSLQVLRPTSGDFTGDNRTDLTLYEESAGRWYVYSLTQGILAWAAALGGPGYAPVLGDFDGDGRTELGVYRAASAGWYVRRLEEDRLMATAVWGGARLEAVVGDFDGDGVSDFGVYERGSGLWYIRSVSGTILAWALSWGGPAFAPVAGDFDGDARSDLAAYDTALGQWYILSLGLRNARGDSFPEAPGGGVASGVGSPASLSSSPRGPGLIAWGVAWGGSGLTALTGDFDGDGRDDLAVYQPGTGNWYVRSLTGGILAWAVNWGGGGFTPVVGDFDGDGKADIGAYHTATGTWYVRTVSGALVLWGFPWGGPGLRPPSQ